MTPEGLVRSPPCPSPRDEGEQHKQSYDSRRQTSVCVGRREYFLDGRGGYPRLPLTRHDAVVFLRIKVVLLLIVRCRLAVPPITLAFRVVVVLPPLVGKLKDHTAASTS